MNNTARKNHLYADYVFYLVVYKSGYDWCIFLIPVIIFPIKMNLKWSSITFSRNHVQYVQTLDNINLKTLEKKELNC